MQPTPAIIKSTKKHAAEKPVTIWIPRDLAAELDANLALQVAGLVGVRPSQQAFLVALVRRAFAAEVR